MEGQGTWNAVDLDAALLQKLKLFTTTAENVWVSTFEPHNSCMLLRKLAQKLVDLILCPCMKRALFAHINHPCAIMNELQNVCRYQPAAESLGELECSSAIPCMDLSEQLK